MLCVVCCVLYRDQYLRSRHLNTTPIALRGRAVATTRGRFSCLRIATASGACSAERGPDPAVRSAVAVFGSWPMWIYSLFDTMRLRIPEL